MNINTKELSVEKKLPQSLSAPGYNEEPVAEYDILEEAKRIASEHDKADDLEELLLQAYMEAVRKQDWKRALDLCLQLLVKRPLLLPVWDDDKQEMVLKNKDKFQLEYTAWVKETKALLNES